MPAQFFGFLNGFYEGCSNPPKPLLAGYTDQWVSADGAFLMRWNRLYDGTFVSFETPSKKQTRLSMQTMFLERADYKKRKSAEPVLMQNAPAYTPEVRGGQTSEISIAHDPQDFKTSIRNKSNWVQRYH